MPSITQDMKFRLSLINYTHKYGITKATVKNNSIFYNPFYFTIIYDLESPANHTSVVYIVIHKNKYSILCS